MHTPADSVGSSVTPSRRQQECSTAIIVVYAGAACQRRGRQAKRRPSLHHTQLALVWSAWHCITQQSAGRSLHVLHAAATERSRQSSPAPASNGLLGASGKGLHDSQQDGEREPGRVLTTPLAVVDGRVLPRLQYQHVLHLLQPEARQISRQPVSGMARSGAVRLHNRDALPPQPLGVKVVNERQQLETR